MLIIWVSPITIQVHAGVAMDLSNCTYISKIIIAINMQLHITQVMQANTKVIWATNWRGFRMIGWQNTYMYLQCIITLVARVMLVTIYVCWQSCLWKHVCDWYFVGAQKPFHNIGSHYKPSYYFSSSSSSSVSQSSSLQVGQVPLLRLIHLLVSKTFLSMFVWFMSHSWPSLIRTSFNVTFLET